VTILNTHPLTNDVVKAGLALWEQKRKAYGGDPEIMARMRERDVLWKIALLNVHDKAELLVPPTRDMEGIVRNFGFWTSYSVYRATWSEKNGTGQWGWITSCGIEPPTEKGTRFWTHLEQMKKEYNP
jgi:hypothetical protein